MTYIKKAKQVIGHNLLFRDANSCDAEFILSLRTNPSKNQYLSFVSNDLSLQTQWLEQYSLASDQIYFIILADEKPCGTVRIYDERGDSFCWGSWLLAPGAPSNFAIESALMIYQFSLRLGFRRSHFGVRKENTSVWRFHERFGAERTGETDEDFLYKIERSEIEKSVVKYLRYLPDGIAVNW